GSGKGEWSMNESDKERRQVIGWEQLLKEWRRVHGQHRTMTMVFADEFNIFRIFKVDHLEAKLHTPFLRNLFDSNGTHGQGTLFFCGLLQQMALDPIWSYAKAPFDDEYTCKDEVDDLQGGSMDLVIQRPTG